MAKRARPTKKPTAHWAVRGAELALWALILTVPFFLVPTARDAFRLPKLVLAESLALASLCFLANRVGELDLRAVLRTPVARAVLPMFGVALLSGALTIHRLHFAEGIANFAVGAAALLGWTLLLPADRLRRLLDVSVWPACLIALLGLLQAFGVQPFRFVSSAEIARLGITSLAGNPGDLSTYLLLPFLLAQHALATGRPRRPLWILAAILLGAALVATQTLTSLIAVVVASALLWVGRLGRRGLVWVAAGAVVIGVAGLSVGPLRGRVMEKVKQIGRGDLNRVLTGRLDGWNAALWMLREHPLTGTGHGTFRAEYAEAKLTLAADGVDFLASQHQPIFANAHNEFLEVAAEWGLPGVLALVWGLWVLFGVLRRPKGGEGSGESPRGPPDMLAWAGVVGWVILALAFFPFRLALTAYPALLFLAWVFRAEMEETS